MQEPFYGVRDVEKVLSLSRSTIRSLIRRGFVSPARGLRREYQFSFQDLIVLRTARALYAAKIPPRRISRALSELRQHLPAEAPLHGLSISAIGDRVVVREGTTHWQADSGQYLLALQVEIVGGTLSIRSRNPVVEPPEDWFERGLELEDSDLAAAAEAYEKALEKSPDDMAAVINRGRVLHALGRLDEAAALYRRATRRGRVPPLLMFNLGVVLEDLSEPKAALAAYKAALKEDPAFADCHYNLARLYEELGTPQSAIRHLGEYRRLTQ